MNDSSTLEPDFNMDEELEKIRSGDKEAGKRVYSFFYTQYFMNIKESLMAAADSGTDIFDTTTRAMLSCTYIPGPDGKPLMFHSSKPTKVEGAAVEPQKVDPKEIIGDLSSGCEERQRCAIMKLRHNVEFELRTAFVKAAEIGEDPFKIMSGVVVAGMMFGAQQ